jgi:hypothetical protein
MTPIIINVRDRLATTRKMVDDCRRFRDAHPIIVDNASSYPPLTRWYDSMPCQIVRLTENIGPRAPWFVFDQFVIDSERPYVVTDCDLDLSDVPDDALDVLEFGLVEHSDVIKVGLSLRIDDVPDEYRFKKQVLGREMPFWKNRRGRFFEADIDTTFAMYRPNTGWGGYGPALRADRPYTAKHVPWYLIEHSEEDSYYFRHLNTAGIFWSALENERYR